MSQQFKNSVFVFLGGALWGIVSLFVTPLSRGGLSSMQISLIREVMAALALIIFALIKDRSSFRIKPSDLGLLMFNGLLCGVLFNFFYFNTIIRSEASVAAMLLYTSPIFVMLFARILFQEHMTPRKYLVLAMTVIGCVFVAGFIGHGKSIPFMALLTGIATGATYGCFTVVTRLNTQRMKVLSVTLYTFIFGTLFMLPFGHPVRTLAALSADHSLIPYALLFGPICSSLANLLFTTGISGVSANQAAILAASEPLVGAIVGMTVWHDSHEPLKLIGIVLVISAIIMQGLEPVKKEQI